MEAGRPRMDMAARPIEEGRTMTQKEYTVTIHGNRMWRRMQEEAARRKRRGRIIQGVHCLLTAALAIALLCVCLGAKEPGQLPEPVAEQQNTVVTLNTISPSPLLDTTTGQLASDLAEEAHRGQRLFRRPAGGRPLHGDGRVRPAHQVHLRNRH